MKSFKTLGMILSAFIIGATLGAYLSHPPQVKAALSGIRLQKVRDGYNTVLGSQVLGFACTQEDCYIATTAQ